MSGDIPVEQQVEALLGMLDELDPWTAGFVTSLNEWIQDGRRLTYRQREVLQDKFEYYDPLWLKPRNRQNFTDPRTGQKVPVHEAMKFLRDRLSILDPADASFVQRVTRLTADGGGVTGQTANRLKGAFLRAQPDAANQPSPPSPKPVYQPPDIARYLSPKTRSATVLQFEPRPRIEKAVSAEVAAAMAELIELKGRLH